MRRVFAVLSIVFLPVTAWATENFPPPEFTSGYRFPLMRMPGPRAEIFSYIDIALLALMLLLTAYLTLKKRARAELVVVTIFSLLYFGFYRHGCICPVGSIQDVALAAGHHGYAITLTVAAFFLLPLLVALFAGRAFCAAVCPLGAAQELALQRPLRVPGWLSRVLGLLPFLYLGLAVLFAATDSAFLICRYDPFVAFFRFGGSVSMLLFGAVVLLVGTVVGRPYCRFLCPYGAILKLLAPLTKWRTQITRGECVNCHLCADACPYGAILPPTPAPDSRQRGTGRRQLAILLISFPFLLALGGWLGYRVSGTLALKNPTVANAETAWRTERLQLTPDRHGRYTIDPASPNVALYRQATRIQRQFRWGSMIFGIWVALLLGITLIRLSIRRQRAYYEIDTGACLACGRCYRVCPVEQARVRTAETELSEP